MATPPVNTLPTNLLIPLTPELRAAYKDLYDKMQAQLDNTMDLAVIEALNVSQPQVDEVLRKDDLYKLNANTAAFNALQKQIDFTNQGLKTLQGQISSIASHFTMAAEIMAAITKILTIVPGI